MMDALRARTTCRFNWMMKDDFVSYVRAEERKKGKKKKEKKEKRLKSGTSKSAERTWHPLACT